MRSRCIVFACAVARAAVVFSAAWAAAVQPTPVPVADFQDAYSPVTFPAGWRYLWNDGPLGNPANYVPMDWTGDQYVGPVPVLTLGRWPGNPVNTPLTFVRPGRIEEGIEHPVIIAYTFSAQDLAAAGASGEAAAFITAYDFEVLYNQLSSDGMSVRAYHGNDPAPLLTLIVPSGSRLDSTTNPLPTPVGTYAAGDSFYLAIGGSSILLDEMRLDFTLGLSPVPEPAAVALAAPMVLLLMRRRRA